MSFLRLIASQFYGDDRGPKAPADRRARPDRRMGERRHRVYPFESRENRLRFAAQAAGFGTYDLDCTTGESVWSPELRAMAGLPPDSSPLSTEEAESLIHPEDRERFLDKLKSSIDPASSGQFEDDYRLLRPDGGICWVRTRGRTFFVGEGQDRRGVAATGVVMDITAGRAAEQELSESRDELSKLLDTALDAIITIDGDQRVIGFNASAARMFHCPRDEAIGSLLERFIPERYRAAHSRHVSHFAGDGATARTMGMPGVFLGRRDNGEEFPIEASITKVQVGNRRRMTVFMRDITDRVRAEEALRRSKEDLELTVRAGNIGIWHLDVTSGTVEWSERACQIFGMTVGETVDFERMLGAVHPADREKIEASVRRTLEEGVECHTEYRVLWPDESIHWVESIGRSVHREQPPAEIRGIVLEITERKRKEAALLGKTERLESRIEDRTRELMRANEALERSNLELQRFAFIAAHDLQTPLRSISGFAQLLQQDFHGKLGPVANTWLDQLVRSAHQMRDLIQDVLNYSRVESRGQAFQPVDLNQLFDDVMATLDVPIRETGASVSRGDLPAVQGDRIQLAQVLQNLIENSLKYRTDEPPRIRVSASHQGGEWVFSVRDNGIGIAEKHLEHIFDIFRRLHTQQEFPGTGIGLAVCRRVVHRHGGRIWAESRPGQGSTFYFTLPDQ